MDHRSAVVDLVTAELGQMNERIAGRFSRTGLGCGRTCLGPQVGSGARSPLARRQWTREQTVEFLRAIAGEKRYLYYHLIAVTGLRRAEAAALRESDVDLRSSEVFVAPQPGQQADDDGELKSPASARTLALDHVTRGLLRRYLADRRNVPSAEDGNRYLFSTPGGRPCGLSLFSHEFKELLYGCTSLPPIRLHDLRHGAASLSLAAGNDLKDIQEMLGHASLSFTADYYNPRELHQVGEKLQVA